MKLDNNERKSSNILFTMDDVNYKGGAHVATFNQIKFLCENGFNISILSFTSPEEKIINDLPNVEFIQFETKQKHLEKMFISSFLNIMTSKEYDLSQKKMKLKMSLHSRKVSSEESFNKYVLDENYLLEIINKYEIVCVPFENSIFRKIVAKSSSYKIQWIHTNYRIWKNTNDSIKRITKDDRELYKNYDKIVFVSKQAERVFLILYPELRNKTDFCYNVIDAKNILKSSIKITNEEQKKNDIFKIVTVTRLSEIEKAAKRSLDVAKRLKDEGYVFEWQFVGSGEDEEMLHKYCDSLDLRSHIKWIGYTTNPYAYVKNADLSALFSYYEAGVPLVVYESLLLSTPVIATCYNTSENFTPDNTGWKVENNKEAIYKGLKHLLDNKNLVDQARKNLDGYSYNNNETENKLLQIFRRKDVTFSEQKKIVRVSVIVPVYNVENYLRECLDSLVKQTLTEIEIIVVDDGSTDSSGEIIEEYVRKYPDKVRSVKKENGGLGDARNFGLKYITGCYVSFIDGDDWVEENMFELMFEKAVSDNYDFVQCDIHGVDDKTRYSVVEQTPYGKEGALDIKEAILYCTRPVACSACTKLFNAEIFNVFKFPYGWYEDLAVIPSIFSYFNKIYYLPLPLYNYRWNRAGSIQSQKSSLKTLDLIKSQQNVLNNANEVYMNEIAFTIYDHASRFHKAHPQFNKENLEFILKNADTFQKSPYIRKAIREGALPNYLEANFIRKIIHYCWFGKGQKSKIFEKCLESWKTKLPDYKIIEWNEENCDINENEYVKKAYRLKKYAYVSDYFRFKAIYEMGGIYLDTDMEIYDSLDSLLNYNAFFGFETYPFVQGGIFGATPNNKVIGDVLKSYQKDKYDPDVIYTVCHRLTDVLEKYGLTKNGSFQVLDDDIAIFPANVLIINVSDGKCIADHHYDSSWQAFETPDYSYRYEVLKHFFQYNLNSGGIAAENYNISNSNNVDEILQLAVNTIGIKAFTKAWIKKKLKAKLSSKSYAKLRSLYLKFSK